MAKDPEQSAIYSPYGAYELKAKYQRNFLFGTLITASFVALILIVSWIVAAATRVDAISDNVTVIKTVAELGPPPTITRKPPQVKVEQPDVVAPKVGIPKPVADDEVLDEDVTLATRDELAEIVAPDISAGGDGDIVVDIDDDDYLPSMNEFVAVEEQAQMVSEVTPEYPRLAKQAGLEGTVWIKALVTKDGTVAEAVVFRTSGTESFDIAALKVAKKNRFKPAIQNGRPVPTWVAYKVKFELTEQ